MRAVLQRARSASVTVAGEVVGSFEGAGLVILLGVSTQDTGAEADALAAKVATLRMLDGEASLVSAGAPALVVSQFTLYGDVRKGRRPSWTGAARPEHAEPLVDEVVARLADLGVLVATGRFRADMRVESTGDGPFTILVETPPVPATATG